MVQAMQAVAGLEVIMHMLICWQKWTLQMAVAERDDSLTKSAVKLVHASCLCSSVDLKQTLCQGDQMMKKQQIWGNLWKVASIARRDR